jgi:hypothetical protein
LLNNRLRLEGTYYKRNITDLLLTPSVAPSTGVNTTTINGGEMEVKGYEAALTWAPIQTNNFDWTSRTSWQQNTSIIKSFPAGVLPFSVTGGGFGNSYGRLRFRPGYSISSIYGNALRADGTVRSDTALGDANPHYVMAFSNDFRYKSFNFNVLAEYRRGGTVSNMTLNLNDEGANTWDYDEKVPACVKNPSADWCSDDDGNVRTLGAYRYAKWSDGNTNVYLQDGSYLKIREINVSYDIPHRWYANIPGVRTARASLAARNLFIISGYNGYDPEVNNGGNLVARFVDLAPFPPSRSIFFSLDLGF